MTQQLEDTVARLDPPLALHVLRAVRDTLVALREETAALGTCAEIREAVRRIEGYIGHVDRQMAAIPVPAAT